MIDFREALVSILAADATDFSARDPETFFASHIGFCPRQLYIQKLGLSNSTGRRGQYRVTRLLQEYITRQLGDSIPELETGVSVRVEEGPIEFIGRCTLFDPGEDVVYALKMRNGWYQFSPPVERHIDQLHIYMRGLEISRGKLVYVSKNDVGDIREWPDPTTDPPVVEFDDTRYNRLVAKATRIRDQVWTNGIATDEADIPFEKCGCYFCSAESLAVPDVSVSMAATADTGSPAEHTDNSLDPSSNGHLGAQSHPTEVHRGGGTAGAAPAAGGTAPAKRMHDGQAGAAPVSEECQVLESDGEHVPRELREVDVWVVWDRRSKVALAPWQAGTMYPCEWAASKDVDPRRPYEKARMVAELPISEVHRSWPFPDGDDLPERVSPAVLLRHEPSAPPVTFVDFDDVRDPTTGAVPIEVAALVETLGGYAEISQSGTGLHVYVRGGLPAGVGTFTAPLADRGTVEIYDHSRFTGGRGNT